MTTCTNCGTNFEGRFCCNCGQKKYTDKDKSLKHLLEEPLHFITHFEGKVFTTLKAIFFHPGRLATDYSSGIRLKYYKPISLYLLIVVVYLIFPLFSGLNMEMKYYKRLDISGPFITKQIETKLKTNAVTEEQLTEKFHQKSQSTSKLLLFLLIPLSVPIIFLLYFYKKRWVFDNFILATEINSFYLLVLYLLFPVLFILFLRLVHWQSSESVVSSILAVVFWLYTSRIFYNVFREKWWISVSKGLLFAFLHTMMVHVVYKTIVFEVTFALL
ncbi:hypothetical protein GCM10027577_33240 [Spirosoma fluminis]